MDFRNKDDIAVVNIAKYHLRNAAMSSEHKQLLQEVVKRLELKTASKPAGDKVRMENGELYEQMCKTCTRAVQCHEECTECDEFMERLESGE